MTTLSRRRSLIAPQEKPSVFSRDEMRTFTALFWSEADDHAENKPGNPPECPSLSINAEKCDCPKTHDGMFKKEHQCQSEAVCIVRITLFPKGVPPYE